MSDPPDSMGTVTITDQRAPGDVLPAGPAALSAASGTARLPRLRAFTHARVGGLPRPFWVLWSGTLINRIGYMVEPFLAYYLTGVRGLSLATTGAIIAVSGAGSVPAAAGSSCRSRSNGKMLECPSAQLTPMA